MDPSKWSVIPRHAIVSALSAFLHPSLSRAILTAHNTPAHIHNHLHIDLAGALLDRSHPGYQTLRRHLRSVLFDTLAVDPDTSETTYAMPPPLPPRSHPRPKTPPAPILPHPPSSTHPPNPPPPSYIFTDFTTANALGTSVANEYAAAAQARGCAFIPVVLTCAVEENARRMRSAERVELVRVGKGLLLDTALLKTMRGSQGLFCFERKEELVLDVGGMEAGEAAGVVGGFVEWVVGGEGPGGWLM